MSDTHHANPAGAIEIDAERDAAGGQPAEGTILDPVCEMIVDVEEQRGHQLTTEHAGKTYAFCSSGCKRSFDADPARYKAKVSAWEASR